MFWEKTREIQGLMDMFKIYIKKISSNKDYLFLIYFSFLNLPVLFEFKYLWAE